MKFLVIGLGSMGKRRIRCLQSLGYGDICGYDMRRDRRDFAQKTYRIKTETDLRKLDFSKIDRFIISTPPDRHLEYLKLALDYKKPAFVEASVILKGLAGVNAIAKKSGVVIAPSCTMCFHPAIKEIKELVSGGAFGKAANFSYHSGQYLPDWHPWENVADFYVSKKETGGCREIVPFELTWISDILGYPKNIASLYGKTADVGADISDTYAISMEFEKNIYGNMLVDVVARYATRSLIINMERGQILWNWNDGAVRVFDAAKNRWIHYCMPQGTASEGYNKNIIEEMYIEEIRRFIAASPDNCAFPNNLDNDIRILKLLNDAEKSSKLITQAK